MRIFCQRFFSLLLISIAVITAAAQHHTTLHRHTVPAPDVDTISWYDTIPHIDTISHPKNYELLIDRPDFDSIISKHYFRHTVNYVMLTTPIIFDTYQFLPPVTIENPEHDPNFPGVFDWIDSYNSSENILRHALQNYVVQNPGQVKYNIAWLPKRPELYRAFVDPKTEQIKFEKTKVENRPEGPEADRKKWLKRFNASLQFSQAYVSPNWYQGGDKNLNIIGQILWGIRLNTRFYPDYLFETTAQYKVGINSTPDDAVRSYNISEDLFQFNLTAGFKAYRKWYYSANVTFKTQIFNSYPNNSHDIRSSFLSPGELNVGLGMTYNTHNKPGTLTLNMSISPLSWNVKSCINNKISETNYGIDPGRNLTNKVGSNLECNLRWKLAYNITYSSRVFGFTDYNYAYADWENTINFNINRYLSTMFYFHMRYDTTTQREPGSTWHKLQCKEILSFGFNYTFSTD